MHLFRAGHLGLNNLSGYFSLEWTDFFFLRIGPCEISPIHLCMSAGMAIIQVLFRQPPYWDYVSYVSDFPTMLKTHYIFHGSLGLYQLYFSWPIDGCYVEDTLSSIHIGSLPRCILSTPLPCLQPPLWVCLTVHYSECGGSTPLPTSCGSSGQDKTSSFTLICSHVPCSVIPLCDIPSVTPSSCCQL